MSAWHHVSHREPCLICGKPDWCAVSADGVWTLCRRINTGAGICKTDKSGTEYWLYQLDRHSTDRKPALELPSQTLPGRAEPAVLDQVYRALLTALSLSPTHWQALRQRGLPDGEILRRGYRTMPRDGRAALVR